MKDNLDIFWEIYNETSYSEVEIFAPDGRHYYFWADGEGDYGVGWEDVGWDDDSGEDKNSHVFYGYRNAREALAAKVLPDGQCLNDIIRKTDMKDIEIM